MAIVCKFAPRNHELSIGRIADLTSRPRWCPEYRCAHVPL